MAAPSPPPPSSSAPSTPSSTAPSPSGTPPSWPDAGLGRSQHTHGDDAKQWCATVCYVDAAGKREPICNKYCIRREKKTTPPGERRLLEWQHRWFARFLCNTQACLRDEAGTATPVVMTREERDRRTRRGEAMPDDYQYELVEPWLAGDVYYDYAKQTMVRTFSPVAGLLRRYVDSWRDGTQQRILKQFGQRAVDGDAYHVAWRGVKRIAEMWRERDK
ncbi:hypothetical protein THASP1DRAFT_29692 [Thamnocephalis sphaerospora]|uniref:Uncharacterized protein n=1 Tax=Thamnocephalis sphaerospora TaxID=78915 RepID=A0A4P9XR14_9FUNG|nr:hypothetical protein THASP1DRAFT_29692 [Thamnocephalis sphaerospora]|eukprot:RKP08504.1 hypothetical protein THASP1DRAFT_29692 [Thamnocephalis sphaerospora]